MTVGLGPANPARRLAWVWVGALTIALAPAETRVDRVGPDDLVLQKRVRTPRNVAVDLAHSVADNDWEVGRVGTRSARR